MEIIGTIILTIILCYVLNEVIKYFLLNLTFKSTFNWWDKYFGEKYTDKFDLKNYLLYYNSSAFTFDFIQNMNHESMKLDDYAYDFLGSYIMPLKKVDDDVHNGFVVPRHLCESICFVRNDYNLEFNDYCFKNKLNPLITWDGTNDGIYPSPKDHALWLRKFSSWYGADYTKTDNYYSAPVGTQSNIDSWYSNPENMFAKYGIPPNSDLVLSLCNDNYKVEGVDMIQTAAQILVGSTSSNMNSIGGWIGFLKSFGNDGNLNNIGNKIFDQIYQKKAIANSNNSNCDSSTKTSIVLNSLVSGAGALGMLAFPGVNFIAIGALALFTGVASGFSAAATHKCPPF